MYYNFNDYLMDAYLKEEKPTKDFRDGFDIWMTKLGEIGVREHAKKFYNN